MSARTSGTSARADDECSDECSDDSVDSDEISLGYGVALTGPIRSTMGAMGPTLMKMSATSTRIIIPFIRQSTLAKLDNRRKKGPDLSQSILDEIGNASVSLFNRRARRSFIPLARTAKRLLVIGADGTPSPPKRSRLPRTCSDSPNPFPMDLSPQDSNAGLGPPISYDFFDCALRRCHVEDLFEIAPSTPLLLLVPDDDLEHEFFEEMAKDQQVRDKVHINGRNFLQIDAIVLSNPKRDTILPLMRPNYSSALIRDLYLQDEGLTISPSNDRSNSFQIIWKQFHEQPCGLQIWASMKLARPVDTILRRFKSEQSLNNVFNYLRLHVEGDDLQSSMLCSEYRHQLLSVCSTTIKALGEKEDILNAISFDTEAFRTIMADCDSVFEKHLLSTLVGWNNYGSPLMSHAILDDMIVKIKQAIPHVWYCLSNFHGLHTKNSRESRRAYRIPSKERAVLFQLFILARVRNNQRMVYWALIMSLSQF
jgi:hypothetical protein